jgi:hypothetical protein
VDSRAPVPRIFSAPQYARRPNTRVGAYARARTRGSLFGGGLDTRSDYRWAAVHTDTVTSLIDRTVREDEEILGNR